MTFTHNLLSQAVRYGLAAGAVGLIGLTASPVFAQDQDEAARLERIEVTGSRIKRTDTETAQPVTVIDRAAIEAAGFTSVADLAASLSVNSFGSFRETSGFASGGAGNSTLSLRGLGSERTLILLDGRRIPGTSSSGGAIQNLNIIPIEVIERVEILRDGASAIYGSDAIAGVVNVITRKQFEGLGVSLQYDNPKHGGAQSTFNITTGFSGERGNVFVSLGGLDRRPIFYRDIPYAAFATDHGEISSFGFPGSWIALGGPTAGTNYVDPRCPANVGDSAEFPNAYRWRVSTGEIGVTDSTGVRCGYDFAQDIKALGDADRKNIFVNANYDITDQIRMNTRALIGRNITETRFAGTPVSPFPIISADNPNNPMLIYGLDPVPVLALFRSVPNGTRDTKIDNFYDDYAVTLDGPMNIGGYGSWQVGATYQRSKVWDTTYNLVFLPVLQDLINSGALDIFGVNGPTDFDVAQRANYTGLYESDYRRSGVDATFSMELMEMGGGAMGLAFGAEYSDNKWAQLNDPQSNRQLVAGTAGGDNINAKRNVSSGFFELGLPFHSMVEVTLAGRWDSYSDFGSDFSPQISLAFRPMDTLLLRGSYGEGFRAPLLGQLYGNISASFLSGIDVVGCAAGVSSCTSTQYRTFTGGNPELGPESSESWTVGAVWQAMDSLSLELGFWSTSFDNWITTSTVNREFQAEANGLPNFVTRNADGTVDFISLQNQNFVGQSIEGVDFNVSYALETDMGNWRFDLDSAFVREYIIQRFVESPRDDLAGELGYPKKRGSFTTSWQYGDFSATAIARYIDGQTETFTFGTFAVGGSTEFDLQGTWAAPWNARISLGVRNLGNKSPALNGDLYGWQPYDTALYGHRVGGRTPYIRYEQSF